MPKGKKLSAIKTGAGVGKKTTISSGAVRKRKTGEAPSAYSVKTGQSAYPNSKKVENKKGKPIKRMSK